MQDQPCFACGAVLYKQGGLLEVVRVAALLQELLCKLNQALALMLARKSLWSSNVTMPCLFSPNKAALTDLNGHGHRLVHREGGVVEVKGAELLVAVQGNSHEAERCRKGAGRCKQLLGVRGKRHELAFHQPGSSHPSRPAP